MGEALAVEARVAEQGLIELCPFLEEVAVVLPGEADAAVDLDAGAGDPDRSVAASTAKTWCSDASRRVMASGLQVHGGIGFTWEHDCHLFQKRAKLDQALFGDARFHRERLAHLVLPGG